MKNSRKPLLGLIALGAALAMPVAFAQDAAATAADAAAQDPTTTTQEAPPTDATTDAAESKPLTWADLDVDGNGTLSKTEAGNVQSLAAAFDDADADKNGELTPDEYKAYVAKANTEQPAPGGSD